MGISGHDDRMYELADAAVEGALSAGAVYADARVTALTSRSISVQNADVETINLGEDVGVGVRALIGSSWGFFATDELNAAAARRAGERAAEIARASAQVGGAPIELADVRVDTATWVTPHDVHPMSVPMSEQADLLVSATATMLEEPDVALARGSLAFWDIHTWLVSSQGHRIDQTLVLSGGGISALATGDGESQVRSYPQSFGQFESGGWETVQSWDYLAHAPRLAEEAAALLQAAEMEECRKPLILEGSQLALQIHESVGHAIELDRILGWEAAFAGTSHLELSKLGVHRYGSDLMNITADATLPGSLGSFAYDDEGTPARSVDIVKDGTWVGVLSGRDTAHLAGLEPGGMVKADGYARLPMVRMTNVGLLPGESSLEEMIASTEDGVYMATNRSWSIDDKRLNFQFGCEIAWEIKDGVKGRMLKNPTYTGITPQFWGSLDMLAGPDEWVFWGTPNCGKGQPMQTARTGHPAAPARFADVRMGVRG
jgi:TldD protein